MILNFFKKRKVNTEENKSFVEHLEDLRMLLFKSVIAIIFSSIACFIYIDFIFHNIILKPAQQDFITYRLLCFLGRKLNLSEFICIKVGAINFQSHKMSGQFMTSFSIAIFSGMVIVFPYILHLIWNFIRPALKQKENIKLNFVAFWLGFLFLLGASFGYFVICPYAVSFFASYTLSPMISNIFLISDYISTIQQIVLGSALIFELPLIIYFLAKLEILSSKFLKSKRRYALVIILITSGIITPPDFLSQILVSLPLYALYEIGILIAIRIEKRNAKSN